MRERKFDQMVLVTYGETLLQNQKADDQGTLYVALEMWGLPGLFQ